MGDPPLGSFHQLYVPPFYSVTTVLHKTTSEAAAILRHTTEKGRKALGGGAFSQNSKGNKFLGGGRASTCAHTLASFIF